MFGEQGLFKRDDGSIFTRMVIYRINDHVPPNRYPSTALKSAVSTTSAPIL